MNFIQNGSFQEEEQDPMDEDEEQLDYEAEFNGD